MNDEAQSTLAYSRASLLLALRVTELTGVVWPLVVLRLALSVALKIVSMKCLMVVDNRLLSRCACCWCGSDASLRVASYLSLKSVVSPSACCDQANPFLWLGTYSFTVTTSLELTQLFTALSWSARLDSTRRLCSVEPVSWSMWLKNRAFYSLSVRWSAR